MLDYEYCRGGSHVGIQDGCRAVRIGQSVNEFMPSRDSVSVMKADATLSGTLAITLLFGLAA